MRYSHCCGVRVGKPFHTRSTGRLAHLRGQSTKAPTELPVLSLTPQAAPVGLMNRLLAPTAVNASSAKLARLNDTSLLQKSKVKLPEEVVGMVENDHVKAWANLRTGDAEIYQTLPTDKPIPALAASSLVGAKPGDLQLVRIHRSGRHQGDYWPSEGSPRGQLSFVIRQAGYIPKRRLPVLG
jgi:hypothetical protein